MTINFDASSYTTEQLYQIHRMIESENDKRNKASIYHEEFAKATKMFDQMNGLGTPTVDGNQGELIWKIPTIKDSGGPMTIRLKQPYDANENAEFDIPFTSIFLGQEGNTLKDQLNDAKNQLTELIGNLKLVCGTVEELLAADIPDKIVL